MSLIYNFNKFLNIFLCKSIQFYIIFKEKLYKNICVHYSLKQKLNNYYIILSCFNKI